MKFPALLHKGVYECPPPRYNRLESWELLTGDKGGAAVKRLTMRETLAVASMLFGMFFGAGNLMFPALMGQMAGEKVYLASAGFLITGVGLPLLGVAALGISRERGLLGLSSRVGRGYGLFFTCALYLTIGPLFAIPRCATFSYTVGIQRLLPGMEQGAALAVFSLLFFAAVLFFSLRPGEILTWIGKVLNPLFLLFLAVLVLRALTAPLGEVAAAQPAGDYGSSAFATGLLEGYNTMDALAGLAFGIIVVDVIRRLGVQEPGAVARSTVLSGVFSSLLMAVIYVLVAVVGAQSRGAFPISSNGGEVLALVARQYFGAAGAVILAVTVTVACLKTAVGLITSCSETFAGMFPRGPSYRAWAVGFCVLSFLIANLGLETIIDYALPVLMFLYPLAIVLILLTLLGGPFGGDRAVLRWTLGPTALAAVPDFLRALPEAARAALGVDGILQPLTRWLPLAEEHFGWVCPACLGLLAGILWTQIRKRRSAS